MDAGARLGSLFFLYRPWNCTTHIWGAGFHTVNLIYIILHKHAQRLVFLVILELVKLTINPSNREPGKEAPSREEDACQKYPHTRDDIKSTF